MTEAARPAGARLLARFTHRVGEFALEVDVALPGGLSVLFGPSGSGKSLTLQAIAGLARPDTGRIVLDDRCLLDTARGLDVPARDRRIGMVFQDGLLFPHRTALDNVALGVRDGSRRRGRRVDAHRWLERVDAAELAARRPGGLSGGQRQRVALARALAGRPGLLLLDEPFSALDLPVRRRMRRLVRELVEAEGVPAVFVTHDPEEAEVLGDRVLHAEPGRISS